MIRKLLVWASKVLEKSFKTREQRFGQQPLDFDIIEKMKPLFDWCRVKRFNAKLKE